MERRGQSESQQHDEATQQQRSCEPRRKRMDERSASSEMARIISDPATGRCYCRGRVLGKVAVVGGVFFFSVLRVGFAPTLKMVRLFSQT